MARIEVTQVSATTSKDDSEPHWEATVDYGEFAGLVTIHLPARYLEGDDHEMRMRQSVEGMERLAEALLRFAGQMRSQWPRDWG
jgi:hypothetical protein